MQLNFRQGIVCSNNYSSSSRWGFFQYNDTIEVWGTVTPIHNVPAILTAGDWTHIAWCRDDLSNDLLFVNGVLVSSTTNTQNYTDTILRLGWSHSTYYYDGYMDDLRITKGISRYSSTFTPPTYPYPNA